MILAELRKVDANNDGDVHRAAAVRVSISLTIPPVPSSLGVLDSSEIVTFAKNCIKRAKADSNKIDSQRRTIFGLTAGTIFLSLAVFGLALGAAFIAKDTSVSSSNVLTTRSGQPVRTELKSNEFVAFAPAGESSVDKKTFADKVTDPAATTSPNKVKSFGCIDGDAVQSMALESLRSPVVLTAPDGSLHKIDGHDIEWNEDGGATIVESSGKVYKIKKDPACASTSERRRLQGLISLDFEVDLDGFSVELAGDVCVLVGSGQDDSLRGTAADDTIRGGPGHDTLGGGAGNDVLSGGAGGDTLLGGAGNDLLSGGAGEDSLDGEDGNDVLSGGDGGDDLSGGDGNDRLDGGAGADALVGGNGNDHLYGEDGKDALYGEAGNDSIFGGTGEDTLGGGDGNDTLSGGAGEDYINGGSGSDTAIFDGDRNSYSFGVGIKGLEVSMQTSDESEETDTLAAIETLVFADETCTVASSTDAISSTLYSPDSGDVCDGDGQFDLVYDGEDDVAVCITCSTSS